MFGRVSGMAKNTRKKALLDLADYLTVKQAAELLGVSVSTLRNWDRSGKLCSKRHPINSYRLYPETELRQLLLNLATQPTTRLVKKNEKK